jgi:hypothetical protein
MDETRIANLPIMWLIVVGNIKDYFCNPLINNFILQTTTQTNIESTPNTVVYWKRTMITSATSRTSLLARYSHEVTINTWHYVRRALQCLSALHGTPLANGERQLLWLWIRNVFHTHLVVTTENLNEQGVVPVALKTWSRTVFWRCSDNTLTPTWVASCEQV